MGLPPAESHPERIVVPPGTGIDQPESMEASGARVGEDMDEQQEIEIM